MSLTDHVRRWLAAGPPDAAFLAAIGQLILKRLHKSGMWQQPPDYLGYPEYHHWRDAFSEADPSIGPAGDFFADQIAPEFDFFERALQAGNSVDALLRQKVKWFLLDRQKRKDPVGYRAFMNLLATLEGMIADGVAAATNRVRGKLRNPTLVNLAGAAPGPPTGEPELARVIDSEADWQPVLRRLSKLGKGAQRLLRERLERFPAAGVVAFLVGELGSVLKERARAASAVWNRSVDDVAPASEEDRKKPEWTRIARPTCSYEALEETVAAVGRTVREAIEESDCTAKVKRGMLVVLADWLSYLEAGDEPPALEEWASQLGMPKNTLWDYTKRLKPLWRRALGGPEAD